MRSMVQRVGLSEASSIKAAKPKYLSIPSPLLYYPARCSTLRKRA